MITVPYVQFTMSRFLYTKTKNLCINVKKFVYTEHPLATSNYSVCIFLLSSTRNLVYVKLFSVLFSASFFPIYVAPNPHHRHDHLLLMLVVEAGWEHVMYFNSNGHSIKLSVNVPAA